MLKTTEITKSDVKKIYELIGLNVKREREKKGASQMELAQAIGYKSSSSISRPELCINDKHFNIEHLIKIADVLEIDLFELLKGIKE